MKKKVFSAVFVTVLFVSIAAVAQPGGQRQKRMEGREMMRKHQNFQACDAQFFTDEQQEQVKQIRLETAQKVKPLRNELRELMAHQQTLASAESADMKAIDSNIEKMGEIKTEIAKIHAAQRQEIRSLLNEEQLLQFDQRKGRMGKGMHRDFRGKNNFGQRGECPRFQG